MRTFPATTMAERDRLRRLLGVLTDVPRYLEDANVGKLAADRYYSDSVAHHLARAVAVGIHLRLHQAFAKGIAAGVQTSRATVRRRLSRSEEELRAHLGSLRLATLANDAPATLALLHAVAEAAHEALPDVVEEAARVSLRPGRADMIVGLEASILARRHAMLAAGCVLLHRRLLVDRLARATRRTVEGITGVRRDVVRPELARRDLGEADVGRRLPLLGRAQNVEWIERPRKPYTLVTFDDASIALHVPHRSLERRGVTSGTVIWATGTMKQGRPPYLESEFEGPGQHRARYFDDYLATLTREAYDLYPGTMLLEWEFPRLEKGRGANDLVGRVV